MAAKKSESNHQQPEPDQGEYPLMLYRDGKAFIWDGRSVDFILVNDEDEEKEAAKDGWVRAFE